MSTEDYSGKSKVSDDGTAWTVETTLGAPGVYDPEKQLSPEEIVALKEKLKGDDNAFYDLPSKVCTHIVMDMLRESEKETKRHRDEIDTQEGSFVSSNDGETREEFAERVGRLVGHWTWALRIAADLPGSEWPQYMTPPDTFAAAIKEVETKDQQASDSEAND